MSFEQYVMRRLSALDVALQNVVRLGRIGAVRQRPYRVRVDLGAADGDPVLTDWIPAIVPRAGSALIWSPLTVGEGCLVLSPGGGDVRIALPALFTGRVEPYASGSAADDTLYLSGDVRIGGDARAAGVADAGGTLAHLRSEFEAHVHPAPGGATGKPYVP